MDNKARVSVVQHPVSFVLAALLLFSLFLLYKLHRKKKSAKSIAVETPQIQVPSEGSGCEYEVFLSFRGPDTRDGITDYLYQDLIQSGIRTFRDDNELRKGKIIGPELLGAIKQSKISIPVFSIGYAESKWCLRELAEMVKCSTSMDQTILPIFYYVKPSDVRHQTGSYAKAFHDHEKHFDDATVQSWRNALKEVGELKGWTVNEIHNRHEGELVKIVVSKVLGELKKKYLAVTDCLVEVDSNVEEINKCLIVDTNDVRIVGIYGMPGIGKTTTAKVVYNRLVKHFECCSFLADVRETSQQHNGIVNLQTQLISNILRHKPDINTVDEGKEHIEKRFQDKKVLILLDDVSERSHLKNLGVKKGLLGAGSRVIITTRNQDVINVPEVDWSYEIKGMDFSQSLVLFSKHALRMDHPPEEYYSLSRDAATTASGLPLALEIIGSYLFGKEIKVWKDAIENLKKIPHDKVQDKLRVSYDTLNYKQQQIFLDVACLFNGVDKRIVVYMWDACGFYPEDAIDVLQRMSLVKCGDNNELRMHDQLAALGREIVRQQDFDNPGKRSRLWEYDDVLDVLLNQLGTEKVLALCLNMKFDELGRYLKKEDFAQLFNLRFLEISNSDMTGNFKNLFLKLIWFQWKGCRGNFEGTNFHPKNLVILDLSWSMVTENWEGWSQVEVAKKLKVLNLTGCHRLIRTPNLSSYTSLERLIFEDCACLVEIDPSICSLNSLIFLNLKYCFKLQNVPELPSSLIDLAFTCKMMTTFPNLAVLINLVKLEFYDCSILGEIPADVGRLSSLETLTTSPSEVVGLSRLKELHIRKCRQLRWLPVLPSGLVSLCIEDCESMERLPDLSNLLRLKKLVMQNCNKLTWIPDISGLVMLKELELVKCGKIREINGLSALTSLEMLDLSLCTSLDSLPSLSGLKKLKKLRLYNCERLKELPGIEQLELLEDVEGWGYDVFLSFRGEDTRILFADYLYQGLMQAGIRTFNGDIVLQTGESVWLGIQRAIKQSKISIPIFSRGYASSKWCLCELTLMVECWKSMDQTILPIFYDVDPRDVQYQTGSYAEAFLYHEQYFDDETVQGWREALTEVGRLESGEVKKIAHGHVEQDTKHIVLGIQRELEKMKFRGTDYVVETHDIKEITRLLSADTNDVRIVGIYGMDGIGKTTTAKVVYTELLQSFECYSFLEDIHEISERKGIVSLQNQLLSDTTGKKIDIKSINEGMDVIQHKFCNSKVLIVLDDVSEISHLEALGVKKGCLGPGSRVIITTRDKDAINIREVEWTYEMEKMNFSQSLQLFSKHAFGRDHPPEEYDNLSRDVVTTASGLPLALMITGSSLYHKQRDVWEYTITRLKKEPDDQVQRELRRSFKPLGNEEKQIFLDIACFLNGVDKRIAFYMWDACGFNPEHALNVLQRMCLVMYGGNNELRMHNLFIALGREVVRQESISNPGERSRLWHNDDFLDVIRNQSGTTKVEALCLGTKFDERGYLINEDFAKLFNVRFLEVCNSDIMGDFENRFSKLRWLKWTGCPGNFKATNFRPKNLVILDLSWSMITESWEGWSHIQVAKNLKVLNLTGCRHLTRTPDLSSYANLERLILEDCESLVQIDTSIGHLKSLVYLNMKNCAKMEELPEELSSCKALVELITDGTLLQEVPIDPDTTLFQ